MFSLVQRLRPGLTFGQVRQVLRGLVGIRPACTLARRKRGKEAVVPVAERWARCRQLSKGSPVWGYLAGTRCLPEGVLLAASRADAVREGAHGSAWFAHRDQAGVLTGVEMRGPNWRGFAKHAIKSLFRLPGSEGELTRVAVCEAPIDALSLAALEGLRRDTLYVATTGGMGPETLACLRALLQGLASRSKGVLAIATDTDRQGNRYADQFAAMATEVAVCSERFLPPGGHNDWNDALVARRGAGRVWHVRTAPERPRAARAASGQGAGGLSSGQGRIRSPMTTPGARGAAARQGSEEE